jgi:hypothetical protein
MAMRGRFPGFALPLLLALLAPSSATAQQREAPDPDRTRFSSFDVGFGGVKAVDASWGLSYGAAFDVDNLFIKGTSLRFGFRFWTADSRARDGRAVDLDDSVFNIMLKKSFGTDSFGGYGGMGGSLHVINARFQEAIDVKERRDGVNVALDGVLGVQKSLADHGFISLFTEAHGSLLNDASHIALHAGIRIRFDRL